MAVRPPREIALFKKLSGSESNVMSTDVPPKLPFKELPKFLRDKIKITPSREKTACWYWTGEIKKPEQRYKPYPATDSYRLGPSGRYGWERATPRATHPLTKRKTDAHRLVYSFATCIVVEDVPRLERCNDERCVSPYHVVPGVLTAAQRKRLEVQPAAVAIDEEWTAERCFALLRAVGGGEGVATWLDKDSAADDAGIPPDILTDDWWAQYVRDNPDDDDDA